MNENWQEKNERFTHCLRGTSIILVVDEKTGILASVIEPVSFQSNQSMNCLYLKLPFRMKHKISHHWCFECITWMLHLF